MGKPSAFHQGLAYRTGYGNFNRDGLIVIALQGNNGRDYCFKLRLLFISSHAMMTTQRYKASRPGLGLRIYRLGSCSAIKFLRCGRKIGAESWGRRIRGREIENGGESKRCHNLFSEATITNLRSIEEFRSSPNEFDSATCLCTQEQRIQQEAVGALMLDNSNPELRSSTENRPR